MSKFNDIQILTFFVWLSFLPDEEKSGNLTSSITQGLSTIAGDT